MINTKMITTKMITTKKPHKRNHTRGTTHDKQINHTQMNNTR